MNYLNIILFLLYTIFSFIINFIIIFLYIRNIKIKKYLVENYFKYMIISSVFGVLDGLTLIINEINNYEIYILFKFNMVYTINLTLMLSYSYRLLVCYYNCRNDNNNNMKLIKTIIFIIIIISILYIIIVNILNKYYKIMNIYLFYPYFIFTILWIFSFPFLILLINKTNKNIRNEYIITFSILLIMLILYVLSINKIIKNNFIINYWNIISNVIVGFSWIVPILRLKKNEKYSNSEDILNLDINYLNSIKTDSEDIKNIYLETYKYIVKNKI